MLTHFEERTARLSIKNSPNYDQMQLKKQDIVVEEMIKDLMELMRISLMVSLG
jgi:coproporphyrinogen III oxidase-like Fe-S oxidoreductase